MNQVSHPFQQGVNICLRHFGQSVRPQHVVHQRLQTIRFIDDDLGVLMQRRIPQLTLQQLGGAPQATQRVFYLVGHTPDQIPGCLMLGQQALLPADTHLTVDLL